MFAHNLVLVNFTKCCRNNPIIPDNYIFFLPRPTRISERRNSSVMLWNLTKIQKRRLDSNIGNQTKCKINGLLIIPISSTCFRRWFRPSSGALDCVYSSWYNAPMMLLASRLDAVELHPAYRPATSWVHYTTSCRHSLVLLRMGKTIAQNMLS
jgi:hypothetical protein